MVRAKKPLRLGTKVRNRLLMQSLEPRILLSYTWIAEVADTGDPIKNGAELANVLNGTTKHGGIPLQLGDTIELAAGAQYENKGSGLGYGFVLPYLTGTGTVTIETTAFAALPSGRLNPTGLDLNSNPVENDLAKILAPGSNYSAIYTNPVSGSNAPHNFTFIGLEFTAASEAAGTVDTELMTLGQNGSIQSSLASTPSNFIIDRCYFHSFENTPGVTDPHTSIKVGVELLCFNATIENSYIADIHEQAKESKGIEGGSNGFGNYNITNNYIEASTENIFFGGTPSWIGQNTANITITHNTITKPLSWDPSDPSYNASLFASTGPYWVKNLIEFKEGVNVLIDQNLFENCWVQGDQRGEGVLLGSINSDPSNPTFNSWIGTGNVTITNNIVRNVAWAFEINVQGTTGDLPSVAVHDVTIQNNLAYNIGGESTDNHGTFLVINGNAAIGANYTIDHNTCFNTDTWANITDTHGDVDFLTNFVCTNNIAFAGQYTIFGSGAGNNKAALDTYASGYTFAGNLLIGDPGTYPLPANNYIPTSQDATGFVDPAGEDFALLSNSSYYTDGTGGSTPGVNMSALTGVTDFVPIDGSSSSPNLKNYYKFDEGSGTSVKNNAPGASTGNGTLSSSTLWTTSGLMNDGLALTGGTSGSVSVPTGFTASSPFTFAAWVNPSVVNTVQYIGSTKNSTGASSFSLYINSSGKLVGTGTTGTVTSSTAMTANKWYLVSLVYDGTNLILYQNGVSVGSIAGTTTTGASTLYIGGNQGSVSSFKGTIDEVRYYSTALSTAWFDGAASTDPVITQAQQLYNEFTPRVDLITGTVKVTTKSGNLGSYSIVHDASTPTYTWSQVSYTDLQGNPGSATATFNANANPTTITYPAAGYYGFQLVVTDSKGLSTTIANKTVLVAAMPSGLTISPATATVAVGGTITFSISDTGIVDQFGNPWTFSEEPYGWFDDNIVGNVYYNNGKIKDNGVVGSTDTATYTANKTISLPGPTDVLSFMIDGIKVGSTSTITVTSGATPPADPTNLSVTSIGISTIGLQWTNNATNETSFTIQRSTDNVTWTTIATPNSTVGAGQTVNYTDSTPVSGTPYYYQVSANNTLTSNYVGTSEATATVIASDEFNYSTSTGWSGGNTGLGFTGNWSVTNTNHANIVSGLTYTSDDGHSLLAANNALQLNNSDSVSNTLTSTVGQAGTDLWVSFEFSTYNTGTWTVPTSEVDLGASTSNRLKMGASTNGWFDIIAQISGVNYTYYSRITPASNATYFMVYQIQYLTTGDIINMYVNPTPGALSPSGSFLAAVLTLPATAQLSATNAIVLNDSVSFGNPTYDELRIGKSYTAVAPDPVNGIPVAPTNLVAAAGQDITLTWTNNATDASGITIMRSTDNSSWSPVGGVDPTTTTWTDFDADPGVAYYYAVYAYSDDGNSPLDIIEDSVATVIASDSFSYDTVNGSNPFNGGNNGVGWASGWSLSNTTNVSVISGSLNYSSGGHALITSGNSVQLKAYDYATGTLGQSIGTAGTSTWVGFEFSTYLSQTGQSLYGEVNVNTTAAGTGLLLGSYNGNIEAVANIGGTNYTMTSSTATVANTTYFVTYNIQYLTTGDIITMYINPTPGVTPTTASGTLTLPATAQLTANSNVILYGPGFSVATFDELRIGSSYASVAPDPFLLIRSAPSYAPVSASEFPALTVATSASHAPLFQNFLVSLPTPTINLNTAAPISDSGYHLYALAEIPAQPDDPMLYNFENGVIWA